MVTGWTSTDFILQWIWVGLIVLCAALFCLLHILRIIRRKRNGKEEACNACPLKDSCRSSAGCNCGDDASSCGCL